MMNKCNYLSGDFILEISKLTSIVHLQFEDGIRISEELFNYWQSFAKNLVDIQEKEKVVIHRDECLSYFYRQPWLEFMDAFALLL